MAFPELTPIIHPVDGIYKKISSHELLVPDNFKINMSETVREACRLIYPNYPPLENRLTINPKEIERLKQAGLPYTSFRKSPSPSVPFGINSVFCHPNYLIGLKKGKAVSDDGEKKFSDTSFPETFDSRGYKKDSRGVPLHPYYHKMLQAGAVVGPGFFWKYGPNYCTESVVFKKSEVGKLQVLIVVRNDTGQRALPGGMVEEADPNILFTSIREHFEETGVELKDVEYEIVYQGVVDDLRQTLNAWPETSVFVFFPNEQTINDMILKAGDDAYEALWIDVTEKNVDSLSDSLIKIAILSWQRKYNLAVAKDGTIGIRF